MAAELGIFDVLKMIFLLGAILLLTYYVTKVMATRASGMNMGTKGLFNMNNELGEESVLPRVIHRLMLSRESSLVLVEYNNCEYMLGVTGSNVQVLEKRELSDEERQSRKAERENAKQNAFSFGKYMEMFKESQGNKGVDKD